MDGSASAAVEDGSGPQCSKQSVNKSFPHRRYDPTNPCGFTADYICGAGISSIVWRPAVVFKGPFSEEERKATMIEREKEVYKHLASPGHVGLVRYYGQFECYLILSHAQNGSIRDTYKNKGAENFTDEIKLRWAEEIAEAFVYIHSRGVLHCDISCNNIFLDHNWAVKIGDFAGSCLDGKEPLVYYETSYSTPENGDVSIQSELFALGSTLYEIFNGKKPFAELEDPCDIEEQFASDSFPDLNHIPFCQEIIDNCWHRRYQSVADLLNDIKKGKPWSLFIPSTYLNPAARSQYQCRKPLEAPIFQSAAWLIPGDRFKSSELTTTLLCGTVAAVTAVLLVQKLRSF